MKKYYFLLMSFCVLETTSLQAQQSNDIAKVQIKESEKSVNTQWKGKRVAFLGDSMTDKRRVGTTYIWWEYLTDLLDIQPMVYGISGNQWDGIYKQALKLQEEKADKVDAIFIFAGTNDYNHGIPIGRFFDETSRTTNYNGKIVNRKYRTILLNDSTFCGRINKVIQFIKTNYPDKQLVIISPIHRGFACFNEKNVQPDENFANGCDLYINDYVQALKDASSIWSVPFIDLFSESGLYPLIQSHSIYFHNKSTDMLHPNAIGDYRIAKCIQYHLLQLPSSF